MELSEPTGPNRRTSFDRIWFDTSETPPKLTVGKTNLSLFQILDELDAGTDIAHLVEAFPMLALDDVSQCLAFAKAAGLVEHRHEPAPPASITD